jgi:D-alanyl-lipoteichoic acid acyltransferase DltB (MBOAT superfamily)
MLFNSAEFLFGFLPLSLLGYFLLGRGDRRASLTWLCLASLLFYAWWQPAFLLVLLSSIGFNYGVSRLIGSAAGRARTTWLVVGVAGNLSALAYYKYATWLVTALLGTPPPSGLLSGIVLPLGISFFTFTQIGYLIDVKEDAAKERGFIAYVLFVTFFPHLIAGPILHHREIMPQFSDKAVARFEARHFAVGLSVLLVGLFKKTVIADGLAPLVADGYSHSNTVGMGAAWLTILAYGAQLYFDFSGYSDMAIGIARMFNIKFPINFNSPYKATNIVEYWQRWHMTLTRYLNAYLFNPLAVPLTRLALRRWPNMRNPAATINGFLITIAIPTFWTMTLAGIWHGAGTQFVIFGLLHSAYIVIYRAWTTWGVKPRKRRRGEAITSKQRCSDLAAVLVTLAAAAVANIFFRAPDMAHAKGMLEAVLGQHRAWADPMGADSRANIAVVALCYGITCLLPNVYQILGADSPAIGKVELLPPRWPRWQPTVPWALAVALLGVLGILFIGRTTEFIYFQF